MGGGIRGQTRTGRPWGKLEGSRESRPLTLEQHHLELIGLEEVGGQLGAEVAAATGDDDLRATPTTPRRRQIRDSGEGAHSAQSDDGLGGRHAPATTTDSFTRRTPVAPCGV